MKYSKEYIIKRLRQLKPALQKRYPISELALFGSVARDDHADTSDIDILVDFNGAIGMGFFKLANELEVNSKRRLMSYPTKVSNRIIYLISKAA